MTLQRVRLLVALFCLSMSASAADLPSLAQYAKDPAKGFIDDAEKAAQNLIAQGQQVGNGLISHAGMELDAAARSAMLGLGDDLNKAIGSLGQGEQSALSSILQLENTARSLANKAYDFRDTTVIDLANLERAVWFTHVPDFFVQSIKNTAFVPQPGDFHIVVTALGFGISAESKADIAATLNGNPITLTEVDQSQNGQAVLGLPNAVISPLFGDKMRVITLSLNLKLSRRHFFGWKTKKYQFPVNVILYPAQLAVATVHITTPVFSWVPVQDVLSAPIVTADKDGCKYCNPACAANNALDVSVPGGHNPAIKEDMRIVSARLECYSGSICAFNGQQNISITSNGTRAAGTWVTCSHPTQWRLRGVVQQWEQTGSSVHDQKINLTLDKPQVIELPINTSLVTVDIETFTKQEYTLVLPTSDPHQVVSAVQQIGTQNLVISAMPPPTVY